MSSGGLKVHLGQIQGPTSPNALVSSEERAVSPLSISKPARRVGIFAQLLLAFLLVALLPLTAFWQFERTRSIK